MIYEVFMNDRIMILIGGGEIKSKATLKIDEYVSALVKKRCGERRPMGLFIGTASHDSMPYFNSFRKTYTSVFDIKADCALICYGEMNIEKISDKIARADFIYVGGGDTVFMLNKWKETGMDKLILEAYKKGTVICGLSAGCICWFDKMYTDSPSVTGNDSYGYHDGLGVLNGLACPHYDDRITDFDASFLNSGCDFAYAVENLSALVFNNERLNGALSAGGDSFVIKKDGEKIVKNKINVFL